MFAYAATCLLPALRILLPLDICNQAVLYVTQRLQLAGHYSLFDTFAAVCLSDKAAWPALEKTNR